MKPSWDDAPEWANWLAMDRDGTWAWYGGNAPCQSQYETWFQPDKIQCQFAGKDKPYSYTWIWTLEPRP